MHNTLPPSSPPLSLWLRAGLWLLVAGVLAGVFALYVQPAFVLTVANQVWGCW